MGNLGNILGYNRQNRTGFSHTPTHLTHLSHTPPPRRYLTLNDISYIVEVIRRMSERSRLRETKFSLDGQVCVISLWLSLWLLYHGRLFGAGGSAGNDVVHCTWLQCTTFPRNLFRGGSAGGSAGCDEDTCQFRQEGCIRKGTVVYQKRRDVSRLRANERCIRKLRLRRIFPPPNQC